MLEAWASESDHLSGEAASTSQGGGSAAAGEEMPFVFVYLCICVFVYLCICLFVYL